LQRFSIAEQTDTPGSILAPNHLAIKSHSEPREDKL